jgi:hypothetical protein
MPLVTIYFTITPDAFHNINYALSHHSKTGGDMLPKIIHTDPDPGSWHSCEINNIPKYYGIPVKTQIKYCHVPGYLVHDNYNNILFVNEIDNKKYNYDWILESISETYFTIKSATTDNKYITLGDPQNPISEYPARVNRGYSLENGSYVKVGTVHDISCPSYYNIKFTGNSDAARFRIKKL